MTFDTWWQENGYFCTCGSKEAAMRAWGAAIQQTQEAYQNKIDALGLAIVDAGYTWTPQMREAYDRKLPGYRHEG